MVLGGTVRQELAELALGETGERITAMEAYS